MQRTKGMEKGEPERGLADVRVWFGDNGGFWRPKRCQGLHMTNGIFENIVN